MSLPPSPQQPREPEGPRGYTEGSPSAVVGATWPEVTYERLPWDAARAAGVGSRRNRAAHRFTYEAAVPARIATLDFIAPTAVAAEIDDATAEVARFDAEMGAEIAPSSSVLLRSESAASSRIENLTASARSIAMAELGDRSRENARLVAANTAAMRSAISLANRLDADAILRMHLALLGESDPGGAGRWREEQVWVGGSDLGPGGADFVPPHHSRISGCIDDLVAYLVREDVPVLSQAAIAHAQFETIHPFTDGNGRTGRALLQAMLRGQGLTRNVTVPISAGLLARTREYFAARAPTGKAIPSRSSPSPRRRPLRPWTTGNTSLRTSARSGRRGATASRSGRVRGRGTSSSCCCGNRLSTRGCCRRNSD